MTLSAPYRATRHRKASERPLLQLATHQLHRDARWSSTAPLPTSNNISTSYWSLITEVAGRSPAAVRCAVHVAVPVTPYALHAVHALHAVFEVARNCGGLYSYGHGSNSHVVEMFNCNWYSGMGKVRGASLLGGNLRGVVRGMWLLVSDFPWTSQFTHFRCLSLDAWNVASDQLELVMLKDANNGYAAQPQAKWKDQKPLCALYASEQRARHWRPQLGVSQVF